MVTILLILSALLVVIGIGCYLGWYFWKPTSKEQILMAAIFDSINRGEWKADEYGFTPCMANINTSKAIYTAGSISGIFCDGGRIRGRNKVVLRQRHGKKLVRAFLEYESRNKVQPSYIEEILGHPFEPEPDLDPSVVKEAKKNLKLWTKK